MDSVHTEKCGEYTIEIHQDPDPINPRRDFDEYGHMVLFHRRYDLGDKDRMGIEHSDYDGWRAMEEGIKKRFKPIVILPVYLMDHSGLSVSTSPFGCPWDSGQVGFIFYTREQMQKDWGWRRESKKRRETIRKGLEASVKTYDQYLRGDVYGYSVTSNGEEADACLGFYGMEEALVAAHLQVKYLLANKAVDQAANIVLEEEARA